MDEEIVIVLPLPARVLSPNCPVGSFGGRCLEASARKRCRRITKEAIEQQHIDTLPWDRVEVSAAFYHATNRRHDTDNAMASLKSTYDGIVDAGVVPDDDSLHMERRQPVFRVDGDYPRVVLTIKRLA